MSKKRLDGKNKLVALTAQQSEDIKLYCREYGIKSQNELIRQAVVSFIDRDFSDSTLKLSSLKSVKDSLSQIQDMLTVIFSYMHQMHGNIMAYHPEIADALKEAAYSSGQQRLERFFVVFQERLKDDPSFFEKLLHNYVTGSLG